MARLSTKRRKALPNKDFAGPDRTFPITDKAHAKLAIAMAARSANLGNISAATKAKIVAKARKKLETTKKR
jgi:hypothetical protein